ncbi:MAG: c-type cytochrome [Planctomycetaceae bacterium]
MGAPSDQLKQLVQDSNATPIDRSNALRLLMASRPEGTLDLLRKMLNDRVLEEVAAEGLAAFEDEQVPQLLLNRYRVMKPSARQAALGTLCSRPSYARALLRAVREGRTCRRPRSVLLRPDKSPTMNPVLALLEETWGTLQTTDAEKQARQASLKLRLTPEFLEHADLHNGRLLYDRTCSACHRLFDSGKEIGPNLTGSNRDNLDYLLENMLAPSAIVPRQYRISTVVLTSGRVLNGLIVSQTERSLTLQTEKELLNLDQDDVELIKPSNLSLMPEGQLDKMSNEEIRDLIGYLQSSRQVAPITASP